MKSLTKKLLFFVFAIAIIVSGTLLLFNYNKAVSAVPDTNWYTSNPSATVYNISSADELAGLAQLVNNGNNFSGKTVNLTADINLTESGYNNWTPIGKADWVYSGSGNYDTRPFSGTFSGGGHTITNLTITTNQTNNGLFGCISNATISDIVFENVNIAFPAISTSIHNAGVAVAYATRNALIKNIKVESGKVGIIWPGYVYSTSNIGGIIGLAHRSTIEVSQCYNKADVDAASFSAGGIMGYASYTILDINNCFNTGNIRLSVNDSRTYMGGILGLSEWSPATITLTNCYNLGNVSCAHSGHSTGGILGANWASAISANIINCFNAGAVTNNGSGKGGLVGTNSSALNTPNSWHSTTLNTVGSGSGNTNAYKSISYMQSPEFADLLGPDYIYNPGGFPILRVFEDESTTTATVIFDYNYDSYSKSVERLLGHIIGLFDIEETPIRPAYDFIKWTETQDGSGDVWYEYDGGVFVQKTGDGDGTITLNPVTIDDLPGTLYAQWNVTEYTLEIEDSSGFILDSYNINAENKNITVNAGAYSTGWMRWEIYNTGSWNIMPDYSNATLNIAEIFDGLISYAYQDSGFVKIKLRPIFANEDTIIYKLTIKSFYESFGFVKLNDNSEPMPYDVSARFEEGSLVKLEAEAYDHYDFVEYIIDGNPIDILGASEYIFNLDKDTTVFVKFERKVYDISISSQYELGSTPSPMGFVGGKDKIEFRIGDRIQVTYRTNVDGFKFSSLKLPGLEDTGGSGVYYLEITKDILDNYLVGNELILVVEYSRQYLFSINFDDPAMNDYCDIKVYNEILDSGGSPTWNPIYGSKYIDSGTGIIIQFTINDGYKISSINGLNQIQIDALKSGELILSDISSVFNINISIVPMVYDISLSAKWVENDEIIDNIDEIDFNTGKSINIEYLGETDSIKWLDVSRYRFNGWYIRHWESGNLVKIGEIYIDNGYLKLGYIYLEESGYINDNLEIQIIAGFTPVYTLTVNASGSWVYEIKINGTLNNDFKAGQFDYGTTAVITVKYSDFMNFVYKLNGVSQNIQDILSNGYYVFTLNLDSVDYIVDLNFDLITKTLNVAENLSGAKGDFALAGGERNGNELKVKYGDTLTFTFEAASGQKLSEWTIKGSTVMTADELVAKGYATRNGNILILYLNNEDALNWLTGSDEMALTIKTIFNPLFTAIIALGGVLITALTIFIALYAVSANKKKKKIKAAIEAGIIGAARFKINFHEDFTKDSNEDSDFAKDSNEDSDFAKDSNEDSDFTKDSNEDLNKDSKE